MWLKYIAILTCTSASSSPSDDSRVSMDSFFSPNVFTLPQFRPKLESENDDRSPREDDLLTVYNASASDRDESWSSDDDSVELTLSSLPRSRSEIDSQADDEQATRKDAQSPYNASASDVDVYLLSDGESIDQYLATLAPRRSDVGSLADDGWPEGPEILKMFSDIMSSDERGFESEEYFVKCLLELELPDVWDSWIEYFTPQKRPSRSLVLHAGTDGPEPADRTSTVTEAQEGEFTSIQSEGLAYIEPDLFYGNLTQMFPGDVVPHRPPGRLAVRPVNDEIWPSQMDIEEILIELQSVPSSVAEEGEYQALLASLHMSVNVRLFDLVESLERYSTCNTLDCRVWRGVLKQMQLRTAIHFKRRLGDWRLFHEDLTFVLRTLLDVLRGTRM